ncbi:MAG TPA: hypothetical protein VFA50_16505 [Stellaceae bacterium]|nr:hypothetical protein [Stellaceae bacterium]
MVLSFLGSGGEGEIEMHRAPPIEAAPEPSVDEIVVALRDMTGRRSGREVAALRGGTPAFDPPLIRPRADHSQQRDAATDVAALRDAETLHLLAENRRLSEQVFDLLKRLEEERQWRRDNEAAAERAARAEHAAAEQREAVAREVREAIEAELRPILKGILRILERTGGERGAPRMASGAALARLGTAETQAVAQENALRAATQPPCEPARLREPSDEPRRLAAARPEPRRAEAGRSARDRHAAWILDLIEAAGARLPPEARPPEPAEPAASAPPEGASAAEASGSEGAVTRFLHRFARFRRAAD